MKQKKSFLAKISVITVTILMGALSANCYSVKNLLDKYQKFPDAEVTEVKDFHNHLDTLKGVEDNEWKDIKSMKAVTCKLNESQTKTLYNDIGKIKKYELLTTLSSNSSVDTDSLKGFAKLFASMFDFSYSIDIYSKETSKDYIKDPLLVIDFLDVTALIYLKGKITPDALNDGIDISQNTTVGSEEAEIGPFSLTQSYKDSDISTLLRPDRECIIIFDDKVMLELHSEKEAHEYFDKTGLGFSRQETIIGVDSVKEHYPFLNASKVVVFRNIRELVTYGAPTETNNEDKEVKPE